MYQTIEEAVEGLKKDATTKGVEMAVTFNPYSETPERPYGYMPLAASHIFRHEVVVAVVSPKRAVRLTPEGEKKKKKKKKQEATSNQGAA